MSVCLRLPQLFERFFSPSISDPWVRTVSRVLSCFSCVWNFCDNKRARMLIESTMTAFYYSFATWLMRRCQQIRSRKQEIFNSYLCFSSIISFLFMWIGWIIGRAWRLKKKTFSSFWWKVKTFSTALGQWHEMQLTLIFCATTSSFFPL